MIFTPLASSSHGNAYLLEDGASRILIECGVPYRRLQKLLGFATSKLDGCLLSHEHKDHARCHLDLLKNGVPVYASEGTAEALECELLSRLPYTETEDGYPRYVEVGPIGPSSYPEDRDVPLRASGPWEELYVHYLGAMVDYHHQDTDAYNDAMSLFSAASDEYRKHYHRTHTPRSSGGFQNL